MNLLAAIPSPLRFVLWPGLVLAPVVLLVLIGIVLLKHLRRRSRTTTTLLLCLVLAFVSSLVLLGLAIYTGLHAFP